MRLFHHRQQEELFVSEDDGATWQLRTPALGQKSGDFGAIAASSRNGQIAYVGFRGLKLGRLPQDLYNGIAKTADAGRTWSIVFRESTRRPLISMPRCRTAPGLTSAPRPAAPTGTEIFFDAPYSLAVAPSDPAICYASDLFRTYRTLDGGKTWAQLDSVRAGRTTIGLPAASM